MLSIWKNKFIINWFWIKLKVILRTPFSADFLAFQQHFMVSRVSMKIGKTFTRNLTWTTPFESFWTLWRSSSLFDFSQMIESFSSTAKPKNHFSLKRGIRVSTTFYGSEVDLEHLSLGWLPYWDSIAYSVKYFFDFIPFINLKIKNFSIRSYFNLNRRPTGS